MVVEEISRKCGGIGCTYVVNALGSLPIVMAEPKSKEEISARHRLGEKADRILPFGKVGGFGRRKFASAR